MGWGLWQSSVQKERAVASSFPRPTPPTQSSIEKFSIDILSISRVITRVNYLLWTKGLRIWSLVPGSTKNAFLSPATPG